MSTQDLPDWHGREGVGREGARDEVLRRLRQLIGTGARVIRLRVRRQTSAVDDRDKP